MSTPWDAVKEAMDLEGVGGGCVELDEAEVVCVVGDDVDVPDIVGCGWFPTAGRLGSDAYCADTPDAFVHAEFAVPTPVTKLTCIHCMS